MSLILGLIIYISYRFSHCGTVYSSKFNASLLMLTLITTMIMNVIGNNIALSLGMVGALSIVRFRTAIKDSRDTVYIFWCIAVGISCGVSYYALAFIGTGFIFLVILCMGCIKSNDNYLFIIHSSNVSLAREIETIMNIRYCGKAKLRVSNVSNDRLEYIYELSQRVLDREKNFESTARDELLKLEGIACVNIVCQNEEMSR